MRDRRPLPALDKAKKLQTPDLNSIGDKNYTDTILKYGGLATKFVQLDTNSKTIVAAINELYAKPIGSVVIPNPPLPTGGILQTASGEIIQTASGENLEIIGGESAPSLTSISIDGDVYKIEGGSEGNITINPGYSDYLIASWLHDSDLNKDYVIGNSFPAGHSSDSYLTSIAFYFDYDVVTYNIPHNIDINSNSGQSLKSHKYITSLVKDNVNYRIFHEVTGTLYAGSTSITFEIPTVSETWDPSIDYNIDIYTDIFGVNPTNISTNNQYVTITFEAQDSDMQVKMRCSQ